jgi:predicted HicB family RNase H-like nuclease
MVTRVTKEKYNMKRSSRKLARPKGSAGKSKHKGIKLVRKSAVKHSAKANRTGAAMRGDENYLHFSGKFTVRLPKSLHHALVERAEKEGVSLNLFVTNALSRTVAVPSKRR